MLESIALARCWMLQSLFAPTLSYTFPFPIQFLAHEGVRVERSTLKAKLSHK